MERLHFGVPRKPSRTSLAQNVMQFPFHEIRAITAASWIPRF